MSQLPNPFPQMGTAASMGTFFEPVGYLVEIKKIKETIQENYGSQPLIFNIIGKYGYGKTHFLQYFRREYEKDFEIFEFNLEKFRNLGPFFLDKVNEFNKKSRDKKGIIFFIDETQNLFEQQNKEELREFQDFLKNFPDGRLKNLENEYINIGESLKKIIVFFALHVQTTQFLFTQKQDIGDRCLTHRLDLMELNYFSAYKIVEKFLEHRGQKIGEWLHKDVIPLIFCLTPFITFQRHQQSDQLNPRIFIEIFYQIFEYWRDYYRKGVELTIDKMVDLLKDEVIYIGAAGEELSQAKLKFKDKEKFENIYNSITDTDIKCLLLSPKWRKLDKNLQEKLKKHMDFFDSKEGYLLNEEKLTISSIRKLGIDDQLKEQIKLIPTIKIFYEHNTENITYLIFNEDIKGSNYNTLKDFFVENCIDSGQFFRLNSEYLKIFFDYQDEVFKGKGLYNYLNSEDKVKFFYEHLKKDLILKKYENFGLFQKFKPKEFSYSNLVQQNIIKPYITFESKVFEFINKWEKFNIYFFTKDEIDTIQQFYDALIEEQRNDANICDIIILEPFIEDYNLESTEIQNFSIDKTVFFKPNQEEFKLLLDDEVKVKKEIIQSYLKNARKIIISMLIEKNFIIPFSNIIIGKDFNQHLVTFSEIVNRALTNKIELTYSSSITSEEKYYSLQDIKKWLVFKTDTNTGLKTLSSFFHINIRGENYYIRTLISDYELKFLNLLIHLSKNNNKENVQINTLFGFLNNVLTASTRINAVELIECLLIKKEILSITELDDKKYYTFKHPKKIISNLIRKLELIIKYDLSQDEIQRYEIIIKVLLGFLDDEEIKKTYYDLDFNETEKVKSILNRFSVYNFYCKKIEESLNQGYIGFDNDLIIELSTIIKNIIENLSKLKTIKCDLNEHKSFVLNSVDFILQELSEYDEDISVFFKRLDKGLNIGQIPLENTPICEIELNFINFFDILNFIFIIYFYDENQKYDEFSNSILESKDKLRFITSKIKDINTMAELSDYLANIDLTEDIKIKFDKIFQDFKSLRVIIDKFIEKYEESGEVEEEAFEEDEEEEQFEEGFEEIELDLEDEEETEEDDSFEEFLISMNLIENLLKYLKKIDKEISSKKSTYDQLIDNIAETLKKVKIFVYDRQLLFKDLNYILALKNNKIIEYDRLLQNFFDNFNINHFYFDYKEEFEIFHRLLTNRYPLAQYYNNFLSKTLAIANQENEFLTEFLLICRSIHEIDIVKEIYSLLSNPEEVEREELNFFNGISEIQQFTYLYIYLSENSFARNFLYYLIFKEIMPYLHNINVINNEKIDLSIGFNDFYKQCLMNKKESVIFKYDPESKKDIESDPVTKYIPASKEDITTFYRKIIKDKEIQKEAILKIMNYEYPPYQLFRYYDMDSELKKYYCPLENKEKIPYILRYFETEKLKSRFEEILEDFDLDHNLGKIEVDANIVNEMIDKNQNTISMEFRHPLLEVKKLIANDQFGISKNFRPINVNSSSIEEAKDIKKKLIHLNRNLNEIINDVIKDLIFNNFNPNKCFPKTKDFFKYNPSIKLEEIKDLSEFLSNNLEEIRKFLRSDE